MDRLIKHYKQRLKMLQEINEHYPTEFDNGRIFELQQMIKLLERVNNKLKGRN